MQWNGAMPVVPAALRVFVLALMLLGAPAGATDTGGPQLIYGAELMSAAERERYRKDELRTSEGRRQQFREGHRERMQKRARDRGVRLNEPEGVVERGDGRRRGAPR